MKSKLILILVLFSGSLFAEERRCHDLLAVDSTKLEEWSEQEAADETVAEYSKEDELAPYLRYARKQSQDNLSEAEEREIFEIIQHKLPNWQKSVDRLVLSNQWFAFQQAAKYFHLVKMFSSISKMDLIQAANLGLIAAAKVFNPDQGRFKTIAGWYIISEIGYVLAEQARTIRLPKEFIRDIRAYRQKKAELAKANGGRSVTDYAVFSALGWSEDKMAKVLLFSVEPTSLNTTLSGLDEDSATLQDMLADDESRMQEITNSENAASVQLALNRLAPKERQIIILRYGLLGHEEHKLEEIGDTLNVSRERVRQIIVQAQFKMRKYLKRVE